MGRDPWGRDGADPTGDFRNPFAAFAPTRRGIRSYSGRTSQARGIDKKRRHRSNLFCPKAVRPIDGLRSERSYLGRTSQARGIDK